MSLTSKQIKDLKPGTVYLIKHARKGRFIAQFIGFDDEPSRIGDPEDKVFLTVKYDVRLGTDQARLNVQGKSDVRTSNLRPSLIVSMQKTEDQQWLREVRVVEEEVEHEPGLLEKLFGLKKS